MSIRIFVTGGTFDKEYNELTGELFFKETQWCRVIKINGRRVGGGIGIGWVGSVIGFDEVGKSVPVGVGVLIAGAEGLFLGVG